MVPKSIPRSIANNNPLNIRIGNVWLGEVTNPLDKEYEQFCTMEYGLRATFVLMRRFINHYHHYTIPELVDCWYQMKDNHRTEFLLKLYNYTGMDEGVMLNYFNEVQMCKLVSGMAYLISGAELDMKKLEKAYKMA